MTEDRYLLKRLSKLLISEVAQRSVNILVDYRSLGVLLRSVGGTQGDVSAFIFPPVGSFCLLQLWRRLPLQVPTTEPLNISSAFN